MVRPSPLAIVGMGCRLPDAPSPETYWRNILEGRSAIRPVPESRLDRRLYFDREVGAYGKSYSELGGSIEDLPFDPARLGLGRDDLENHDIAQLWALDVADRTFADAGYDPDRTRGLACGVFVGHARGSMLSSDLVLGTAVDGLVHELPNLSEAERERVIARARARYPARKDGGLGTLPASMAGRIARHFGLTGRHMIVDAACASSFAALELAAHALSLGKLDYALFGGASYSQTMSIVFFAQSRALSPDGSFPFDARANGFISSDGIALFLLRRLDDALRDGDRIHGVIRGVGGSCDGKGKALWAPKKEGQILAIERAYHGLDFGPESLGLVEAHGTSTQLGDATEVEALSAVLGTRAGRLPLGSVKGNIGHTRETAGAAGLLKAVLALEHATIPPTGGLRDPNPEIPWAEVPLRLARNAEPWAAARGRRRAGVDAFGIGGLNFHVVVEEAPPKGSSVSVEHALTRASAEPLAIVGVGLRLPEASSPASFVELVQSGRTVFSEVPKDRWSVEVYGAPAPAPHRSRAKRGAFVRGFEADWRRYKIPPKLVERTDPLQFMMLEAAMDALDTAAIDLERTDRSRVAVVVGTSFGTDYQVDLSLGLRAPEIAELAAEALGRRGDEAWVRETTAALRAKLPSINEDSSGSISSSTIASRVSKTLDLNGPTFALDASCTSSLAALEAAADMLSSGAADLVIMGGADRSMNVQRYESYDLGGLLTDESAPRALESDARGFLPGEGAVAFALQRLSDAEAAKRPILAVVRAVGSATDRAPEAALETAITRSHEHGRPELRFLEAHGLGVPAFDQAELAATRRAYGLEARAAPLPVSTSKATFGHTQGAAGAVAMLEAALSLRHRLILPTPGHGLARDAAFELVHEPRPISAGAPGLAAVNGLGLSGAAYHVLLDEPPAPRATMKTDVRILRLHAADLASLEARFLEANPSELFEEPVTGRGPALLTLAAETAEDVVSARAVAAKAGLIRGRRLLAKKGLFVGSGRPRAEKLAILFSGQGAQYPGMLEAVHDSVPGARLVLARIDTWLDARHIPPLSTTIFGSEIPNEVLTVQLAILAADLMAFAALRARGLEADFVTGHSYGDYAAMVAAGAWTLEDALEATVLRAEAIEASTQDGGMLAVPLSREEIGGQLTGISDVYPSNLNAPRQTVLSGTRAGLEAAEARLTAAGVECRRLSVPRPYHSPLMAAAEARLRAALDTIPLRAPSVPFLSSVTGALESEPDALRRALVEQLVRPVDFVRQIETLISLGATAFVEAGPKGTLASLAAEISAALGQEELDVVPTDDPQRPGSYALARAAAMWAAHQSHDESLRPAESAASDEPRLSLFDRPEEDTLARDPGFSAFWRRHRAHLAQHVRELYATEQSLISELTSRPNEHAPELDTALPEPISDTELHSVAGSVLEPAQPEPAPTPAPSAIAGATLEEVTAFLLAAISEQTGYPAEIIDLDADMEADLGIDTVKQAQVMGKVRDRYRLSADPSLTLADVPTLRKVAEYVARRLADAPRAAPVEAPAVSLPVVDLTERRRKPKTPSREKRREPAREPERERELGGGLRTAELREDVAMVEPRPEPSGPRAEKKAASAPINVLRLEGTPREMGRQHGTALREEIRELLRRYEQLAERHGFMLADAARLAHELEPLFAESTREEIAGIAEGSGLPYEYVLAYNLDAALFPAYVPGCTQAFVHEGETFLHFVNEDSPLLLRLGGVHARVVQIRDKKTPKGDSPRTVMFSTAGQVAGPNALSELGLTVTSCALLDGEPPTGLPEHRPHPELVKELVESCRTLDEAAEVIEKRAGAGRWGLLVSETASGRALYAEVDDGRVLWKESVTGRFVGTNHARCGPARNGKVPEHSQHRLRRAVALLDHAKDASGAQTLLRDRFDCARERDVVHPTMNTVRRVDNVMSLVVEPRAQKLHVTDRVVPAGSAEEPGFSTLAYHRPKPAKAVFDGLEPVAEVMTRHVVRLVEEPSPARRTPLGPKRLLLVGDDPRAETVASTLAHRGSQVVWVRSLAEATTQLDRGRFDAWGFFLAPSDKDPFVLGPEPFERWMREVVETPFSLFVSHPPPPSGFVFAITTLGGGLGFMNQAKARPDGGALQGFLKALRHERPDLTVLCLDVATSASASEVTEALLEELDLGAPRLEVGRLRGKRVHPVLAPRPATVSAGAAPLPRTWVVSGGARGVTAQVALRLARLHRPTLHLLGSTPLPDAQTLAGWKSLDERGVETLTAGWLESMKAEPGFVPVAWSQRVEGLRRVLEIARNIDAMQAAGAEVHYHALELASWSEVDAWRRRLGALSDFGLIHGAGVELAKPLAKKTPELLAATVGGKVRGLMHLLRSFRDRAPSQVVVFSSVSGRFGGHGQTDYALANELLARLVAAYRGRHPQLRVSVLDWPAWDEVGMAARGSARVFLEQAGQAFMPPEEGANHVVRELWSGLSEAEVLFARDLRALDLDRQLPAEPQAFAGSARSPVLGSAVRLEAELAVFERTLRPEEPFLDQHRMGATPILPGVIGLEMFAELIAQAGEGFTVGEVEIQQAIKVRDGRQVRVEVCRCRDQLELRQDVVREDGVVLDYGRSHIAGLRVPARALPKPVGLTLPKDLIPYPYPERPDDSRGARAIFHGPVFRALEGVALVGEGRAVARLVVPPVEALVAGARAGDFRLPAPLLDGCLQAAGLVGRLLYGLTALPMGFGRVDVSPRAVFATGETVTLEIQIQRHGEDELMSNLLVVGADGPLAYIERYRAKSVPGALL